MNAKRVLVCMIYNPDETADGSWADRTLSGLGYNADPSKLQSLIRRMFALATQKIIIPGVDVVGVPLFIPLDGKNTADYSQRVEPSASGGEKMAKFISKAIHDPQLGGELMKEEFHAHEQLVSVPVLSNPMER